MEKISVGYIRVSTKEQAREGYSLAAQKKMIENYASGIMDIKNINMYIDDGYSGKNDKRPRYMKLLKLIKENKVENIVIYKADRVSRNLIDFNNLMNLCQEHNVNLISINDNLNFNSAVGRCVANVIMSFAQMEREQISERTIIGIEEALEKGIYAVGGKLPLGVERTPTNKLKYNKDIEIVKYIFKLDKKDYSFARIKEEVNLKYGETIANRVNVYDIVKNPLYRGYRQYNGKKYYFLKPIVKEEEENLQKVRGKLEIDLRKRNLKEHYYMFENYLNKDFNVTTNYKILSNGTKKEYKYYLHKRNKALKIPENKIICSIEKYIQNYEEKKIKSFNKLKLRLDEFGLSNKNVRKIKSRNLNHIDLVSYNLKWNESLHYCTN